MKPYQYLLLFLLIASFSRSFAQEKNAIVYRTKIELINGVKVKGYLASLNDSSVQINPGVDGSINSFPISEIQEIRLRRKNSVGRGLLIGLGAGALLGAGIGYISYTPCNCWIDLGPGFSAIGGALIGTIAGGVFGAAAGSGTKKFVINGNINNYNQLRYNPVFYPKTTNASPMVNTHN